MFLHLGHHEMYVYPCTLRLARETYRFITTLPAEERYAMAFQLRKSSTSVVLNLAEGAARKSLADRTHFYRMARASVVEIDATLDTANELGYIKISTWIPWARQLSPLSNCSQK